MIGTPAAPHEAAQECQGDFAACVRRNMPTTSCCAPLEAGLRGTILQFSRVPLRPVSLSHLTRVLCAAYLELH